MLYASAIPANLDAGRVSGDSVLPPRHGDRARHGVIFPETTRKFEYQVDNSIPKTVEGGNGWRGQAR